MAVAQVVLGRRRGRPRPAGSGGAALGGVGTAASSGSRLHWREGGTRGRTPLPCWGSVVPTIESTAIVCVPSRRRASDGRPARCRRRGRRGRAPARRTPRQRASKRLLGADSGRAAEVEQAVDGARAPPVKREQEAAAGHAATAGGRPRGREQSHAGRGPPSYPIPRRSDRRCDPLGSPRASRDHAALPHGSSGASGLRPERALEVGGYPGQEVAAPVAGAPRAAERYCLNLARLPWGSGPIKPVLGNAKRTAICSRTRVVRSRRHQRDARARQAFLALPRRDRRDSPRPAAHDQRAGVTAASTTPAAGP